MENDDTRTSDLIKSGSVLLSHVLRHSTIAAEDFRFPVRDGVERLIPRHCHQTKQDRIKINGDFSFTHRTKVHLTPSRRSKEDKMNKERSLRLIVEVSSQLSY